MDFSELLRGYGWKARRGIDEESEMDHSFAG
jgi:hypothetical protein